MFLDHIRIDTKNEAKDIDALSSLIMAQEGIIPNTPKGRLSERFLSACIQHTLHINRPTPQNLSTVREKFLEAPTDALLTEMSSSSIQSVSDTALDLTKREEKEYTPIINDAFYALSSYLKQQQATAMAF